MKRILLYILIIIIFFSPGRLFSRVQFKGRDALFFIVILIMVLPFQAVLLPNYIQLRELGMMNTRFALTLPMFFSPFAVFMFRQFMKKIPQELLDYALIETSSVFHIFRYVIIPEVLPAIGALAVLIFCSSWNMISELLIFAAENTAIQPLSIKLSDLPQNVSFAGGVVYMYPILILYLAFRKTLKRFMEEYKW